MKTVAHPPTKDPGRSHGNARLVNEYGPRETTQIFCQYHRDHRSIRYCTGLKNIRASCHAGTDSAIRRANVRGQ